MSARVNASPTDPFPPSALHPTLGLVMSGSMDTPPAPVGKDSGAYSGIKRSAALRTKYRVFAQPTAFHASLVAQHPQNRGGIAINGGRCDEILRQVVGHFDEEEANHGAVAIEERR